MRQFKLFQQEFGAPPSPPPQSAPPPPPVSGTSLEGSSSSRAIWALILGIAAWVLGCGIFTGIPAWILGKKEINDIEAGLAPRAGKTIAQIGMWLGIINVILSILALIVILILLAFGVLGSMLNY
jgi:hypothetical protein